MKKILTLLILVCAVSGANAGNMERLAVNAAGQSLNTSGLKEVLAGAPVVAPEPVAMPYAVRKTKQRMQLSCRIYGSVMDTFRDSNLSATIVSNTKLVDLTFKDLATGQITASKKVLNGDTAYKPIKPSRKDTYPYFFVDNLRTLEYTIYLPKDMMSLESFKAEITATFYSEGGTPAYKTAYCRVK